MTETPIRVAIVDDHAMVREALSSVLGRTSDLKVVALGGDVPEARSIVREDPPDVLVLDYNLPQGNALDVLEEVQRRAPAVRVLVLTVHESLHYAIRVLEAGASGFLVKSSAVEELVDAIRQVHAGEIYITSAVARRVLDQLRRPRQERRGVASLSTREFQLLSLLGAGMGIKEAARELKIGVSTASTYRARLMSKLSLESTVDLIRFALENKLVN